MYYIDIDNKNITIQNIYLTKDEKYYILYTLIYTNICMNKDISPHEIIRVSISEAARLFGVNNQTIRRAIKSGEITYIVVASRYKINFESLIKWSQEKTTIRNKLNKNGIGQYIDKWKIRNTLYSPSKKSLPHNLRKEI